ncbi:MAG: hypothetical protein KJ970_11330 [Candidatus Eisenbacteria bacterium]|uniref:Uncharacterized protein n=1 Tax=Eiseniibacteriota bacterium TaxID=2212470 RepID=A0A948W6H3_UNCEI|nr:hypothetical protein [Candidatus Eisenbacteria bacterium]MBU1950279.1 hypothetical protein [Candidatus Eisenbacteria bacterium]MBU2691509.1 hypothetical protein [Candidatus Eisenbacteria bacterium]
MLRRIGKYIFPVAGLLLLFFPGQGDALDGRLDIWNSHQNGRAGAGSYNTFSRRETYVLNQPFTLLQEIMVSTRLRWVREFSGSETNGLSQEWDNHTLQPSYSMSYRTRRLNLGLKGDWFEKESSGATALAPLSTRSQHGGWFNARSDRGTRLNINWTQTLSKREGEIGGDKETREKSGFLDAEQSLGTIGQIQYKFSALSSDVVDRQVQRTDYSHGFDLGADKRFADNRIDLSVRARTQYFIQKAETGGSVENTVLLQPFSGHALLDDTPEIHDPLEGDLISVPELFDRDRESPTSINIGDSAPVVREFGGDYRNIQYDFGDQEELSSAILFVDERLLHPELFQWRLFVTDDPEGRIWTELETDRFSIGYNEWSNVHQGWAIDFNDTVSARYFKLVDVKFGPTVPDLFITELEVYTLDVNEIEKTEERSRNDKLDASVSLTPIPILNFRYQTTLRQRVFYEMDGRDLDAVTQGFHSRLKLGGLILTGMVQTYRLTREAQSSTNVEDYEAAIARGSTTRFTTKLSWNHSVDHSTHQDKTTNYVTLALSWQATPRLQIKQRFSHGRREDFILDVESVSNAIATSISTRPLSSLSLDFNRTDRWVNTEAGAGFQRFDNTNLTLNWAPLPLISFSSTWLYQVRKTTEWSARHSVAWSPLSGGSVEIRINGNGFQDSRTDATQWGGGVSTKWRMRPRLLLEGGIETQRYEVSGERVRAPISTNMRVSWSF